MEDRAKTSSEESVRLENAIAAESAAVRAYVQLFLWPLLRSRIEVDDVVQDVLVNALRRRDKFNATRGSLRRWLELIAKTVISDRLRQVAANGSRIPIAREGPEVDEIVQTATSLTSRIANKERRHKLIAHVLSRLTVDERALLRCRVADLPGSETARILQVTPGAAKARWHRLVEKIRTIGGDPFHLDDLEGVDRGRT